jgi:DNA repair protein RecO (recombination protein O)
VKAFVLRKIPYGDSDLIVRFLQENGEVVSGFAAGARKSKKRFSHHFDLTGLYDLEFTGSVSKEKLRRIHRCDLLNYASPLSSNIELLCRWAMVLEWISLDEGHEFDFEEVEELRSRLGESVENYHVFFIRQMKTHGLLSDLSHCLICGGKLQEQILFNFAEGGAVHTLCGAGKPISLEALEFIQRAMTAERDFPSLSAKDLLILDEIIVPFLEWQLGRALRGRKVFAQTAEV